MAGELKSIIAAGQARKVQAISEDLEELNINLQSLINISQGEWKGKAHDAFCEVVYRLKKEVQSLAYDVVDIKNDILRVAYDCNQEEAELERIANSMESSADGSGGGFSEGSGGGGGGGGGGF